MLKIINPKYESIKVLKNTKLSIRLYSDSVSVNINNRKDGCLLFHRSYSEYDENAFNEIKSFIELYDNKIIDKQKKDIMGLYYDLANKDF